MHLFFVELQVEGKLSRETRESLRIGLTWIDHHTGLTNLAESALARDGLHSDTVCFWIFVPHHEVFFCQIRTRERFTLHKARPCLSLFVSARLSSFLLVPV